MEDKPALCDSLKNAALKKSESLISVYGEKIDANMVQINACTSLKQMLALDARINRDERTVDEQHKQGIENRNIVMNALIEDPNIKENFSYKLKQQIHEIGMIVCVHANLVQLPQQMQDLTKEDGVKQMFSILDQLPHIKKETSSISYTGTATSIRLQ